MGKKLDRLFGRGFRASKFNPLLKLAVSRATILQNQRRVRVSLFRSDVAQLLRLGHHDRALLRGEEVIREQNMLDVYVMVKGYCSLLSERVTLIEQEKVCPEELKEAMSGLIFIASRCGELPELREVHKAVVSLYGKEFVARSVELRNGCAVSPKIIQKLSVRQPPWEIRTKLIREIASENGITLRDAPNLEERPSLGSSGRDDSLKQDEVDESDSLTRRMEFKDVADAAQVAFESAAYAAAAARAAVKLSRSRSQSCHPDHGTSPDMNSDDAESYFEESDDVAESKNHSSNYRKVRDFMNDVNESRKAEEGSGDHFTASSSEASSVPRLDLEKKPISLRTKHFRGY